MALEAEGAGVVAGGLELRHLRALVALAGAAERGGGSSRGDAEDVGAVTELEALVGTRLLEHTRSTVGLTGPGRALLGAAEAALDSVDVGLEAARSADAAGGTLGLMTAFGYRWLPALRRALAPDGPAVRDIDPRAGFAPLLRGVTVGVYPLPAVVPDHLAAQTLALTDAWIALPRRHRLAGVQTVPLAQIAADPLILPACDARWREHVERACLATGRDLRLGPPARTMFETLALVAEGRGWSIAAARGDFHPWEGVALRRVGGMDRVRIAAVWDSASASPVTARLVEALAAIAAADPALRHDGPFPDTRGPA